MSERHDRRKHPRNPEKLVTTYEVPTLNDRRDLRLAERPCWLREVSEGGACIETEQEIGPRTAIILHITRTREGQEDRYLSLRGETRWMQPLRGGRPYRVGIEFKIVSTEDRAFLRDYVSQHVALV